MELHEHSRMGKGSEFIAAGPGSVLDVLPQVLLVAFMHVLQQNPPPALAVSAGDRDSMEKARQESRSIPGTELPKPTARLASERRDPPRRDFVFTAR